MRTYRDLVQGNSDLRISREILVKAEGDDSSPHRTALAMLTSGASQGWEPIPKGTHGGQRKKKLTGDGKGYEYRYPDGKGGWTSTRPSEQKSNEENADSESGDPNVKPGLFSWLGKMLRFSSESKVKKFSETPDTYEDETDSLEVPELGSKKDLENIPLKIERMERMTLIAEDPIIAASIAKSTDINGLLNLREILLRLGAKEPKSREPKVIVVKEKGDGKTPLFPEKPPKKKRVLTDEEKKARARQRALNKALALVNKRLSQIAPGIIAEESNRRVQDYLKDLQEQERAQRLEEQEAAEEAAKEKKKLNLGFITSASEIDKMQPPFVLKYKDDETLKFEDALGGVFMANIQELQGKELKLLMDKVEDHPDLANIPLEKPKVKLEVEEGLEDIAGLDLSAIFESENPPAHKRPDDDPFEFKPPGEEPPKTTDPMNEVDPMYEEALRVVARDGRVSRSHLSRRLSIGFNRAARIMDQMERDGLISNWASSGTKPVKVNKELFQEVVDLWDGIQAFGAKPEKPKAPSPGTVETAPANLEETEQVLMAPLPKVVASSISPDSMKQGGPTKLYVAGEFGKLSEVESQWAVVEADSIVTSHDPKTFSEDERHNVGNERAYHRDKAEQAKVISQANDLRPELVVNTNPDATNGAPIVDENGVVLGGNSRSMSMKRVYSDSSSSAKANELRDYIKNNAAQFGLTSDDVGGIKNPILVRQVAPQDDAEKQLLVRQLNENFTQAMDPRTMAVAQARRFNEKAVSSLAENMESDETLRSFLDSKRGKGFIDSLRGAGIISQSNQNAYINQKTGKLNENGKSLVENVIVGKMIPNADLLTQVSQKTMNAIARSAPYMMQASGFGEKYDIRDDLAHAIDALVDIQSRDGGLHPTDMEKRKEALESWHRNMDSESYRDGKLVEHLHHPAKINPRAKALLQTLVEKPGPVQMAKVFKKYAEAVDRHSFDEANSVGMMGILGDKDHNDVFHQVFSPDKKKESEAQTPDNPIPAVDTPSNQGGLF